MGRSTRRRVPFWETAERLQSPHQRRWWRFLLPRSGQDRSVGWRRGSRYDATHQLADEVDGLLRDASHSLVGPEPATPMAAEGTRAREGGWPGPVQRALPRHTNRRFRKAGMVVVNSYGDRVFLEHDTRFVGCCRIRSGAARPTRPADEIGNQGHVVSATWARSASDLIRTESPVLLRGARRLYVMTPLAPGKARVRARAIPFVPLPKCRRNSRCRQWGPTSKRLSRRHPRAWLRWGSGRAPDVGRL